MQSAEFGVRSFPPLAGSRPGRDRVQRPASSVLRSESSRWASSIAGRVTLNGNPVQGAKIYISVGGTLPGVYGRPGSSRPDPVLSSGDPASSTDECNEGGYCISQLPPDVTYRITAKDASDNHSTTVDVPVTTGRTVLDIQLTP